MDWQPAPDALIAMMKDNYGGVLNDVRYARLTFCEDGYLVEARIGDDDLVHAVLGGKEGVALVPLGGDVCQLGRACRVGGLTLNRDNVADYTKFFCGHLARSRTDAFTFIESLEGRTLDNGHKLRDMRVKVGHQGDDGAYWVGGYQAWDDTLFRVLMLVQPDGLVQMRADLKLGDLVTVN